MLVSAVHKVHQLHVSICPLPLEPLSHRTPIPLHPQARPSRSPQSAELSSLCTLQTPRSDLFHTWSCLYIRATLPIGPTFLFPFLCPHVPSLWLHLYSCPANMFICIIFLQAFSPRNPTNKGNRPSWFPSSPSYLMWPSIHKTINRLQIKLDLPRWR